SRDDSPLDLLRPSSVLKWSARALLRKNLASSLASPFPADLPDNNELELLAARNAMAAAAVVSVTAVAMRRCDEKRLRVNQRGVFINVKLVLREVSRLPDLIQKRKETAAACAYWHRD